MSSNRSARALCCIGVLAALGSLLATATPAGAQQEEREISIWLDSPPSLAPVIDLRLSRAGTDITDAECGPITTPSDSPHPQRRCADLGDGTFAVSLTGAAADAIVTWECTDIVAARNEHTAIPLGNGFTNWTCFATVSPPGVIIEETSFVDDDGTPIDGLEVIVEDNTGTAIPPCELDKRGNYTRQWCGPLADGTYEAVPQNIPAGLRAAVACSNFPQTFNSRPGPFTIDAQNPRWICDQPIPYAPLTFAVFWDADEGQDLDWFLQIEPAVTDADGTDRSASCTENQRSVTEPTNLFIEYSCVGLDAGAYTVAFSGIPSDFGVETDCDPVDVPQQPGLDSELCSVFVTSVPLDVPPDDEPVVPPDEPVVPPDEPPPTALPDTGTASWPLLAVSLAALASGTTLLVASRRRSLG